MRVLTLVVLCLLGTVFSQNISVPQQAPQQAPVQAPQQAPQQAPVQAPQQVPAPQAPAPEQLNEATYYYNYPTPAGLSSTSGVNPLAFCMIQKLERWVVFWGYYNSNPTATTIQNNSTSNEFQIAYTTNSQGATTTYTNGSIPYQPTTFQPGTYYFTTKLSVPFFLAPRGSNGFGYPYYSTQWQLNNWALTVLAPQVGVTSYNCPSSAAFYIVRGGITNANASAASIQSQSIAYLQSFLNNVTSDRIAVKANPLTQYGSGVYNFTVVANDVPAYSPSRYNLTLLNNRWNNYQPNAWPPEFEPTAGWELVFYLVNNLNMSTWESYPTTYTGNTAPVLYTYVHSGIPPRSPANNPNGNQGQTTMYVTGQVSGVSSGSAGGSTGNGGNGGGGGGNGSSNVLASIVLITLGVLALVVIF